MLRKRTAGKSAVPGEYYNYITATYNGTNVKLLGDAFDISQIKNIVYNGAEIGAVRSYNFGSNGQHTVKILMADITTTCQCMFDACADLKSFDVSKFDMSNVTTVQYMFRKTDGLISASFSDMNWGKLTNAYGFFDSSSKLENVVFKNITSPNLNNLGFAFNWTSLKSCDMTGLDLSNVTDMSGLFKNNWWLKTFRISSSVSKVNNVKEMFYMINTRGDFYYSKANGKGIINPPWLWKEHAV